VPHTSGTGDKRVVEETVGFDFHSIIMEGDEIGHSAASDGVKKGPGMGLVCGWCAAKSAHIT
jgi:hypothetical protein